MNDLEQSIWLPPAASNLAKEVDPLYYFILWASTAFFAIVLITIIYFVKKYRSDEVRTKLEKQVSHNSKLEIFWTAIPTILIIIVFFWGARSFLRMQIWPVDAMQIDVYANAWHFDFMYPYEDTKFKSDSLVVPEGVPVKLMMTGELSQPIHSLYIPDFRVKRDIMANRYSQLWFESENVGTYDFYCTEYCGDKHSQMNGHVVVMPQKAEKWNDANQNEKYDKDEIFTDTNENGKWDQGESFIDIGNGVYDEGEPFVDVENGKYDKDEVFTDTNGNNEWDQEEDYVDVKNGKWDKGEKFTDIGDGVWTAKEEYEDKNGNGQWDTGYDYWFARKVAENYRVINDLEGVALGEDRYTRFNCHTCHSNGVNQGGVGPSFKALFGSTVYYEGGDKGIVADEDYITESIRYPAIKIKKGYPDQMPKSYEEISQREIDGIIEYIKTLK